MNTDTATDSEIDALKTIVHEMLDVQKQLSNDIQLLTASLLVVTNDIMQNKRTTSSAIRQVRTDLARHLNHHE